MASFSNNANVFLSSPYKVHLLGPNPATIRGQAVHINMHPKERKIIYASGKYIVVRNIDDPTDCFVYRGHATTTTVAKFSPNGYWVASGDISGKVRVWSWDNPEHLTKLETPVFAGEIKDLDWDVESKKIVAVGDGSPMLAKVFTWDTGNSVGEIVGHTKRILSVSYKPSRPFRIITAAEDMKTIVFAGPPFKLDHSNHCHTNFVNCVRFAPNGEIAASVGSDKKIQFYDGKTGEPIREIVDAHDGSIYSIAFCADGSKMITASADKTVKLWDTNSLTSLQTFSFSDDPQVGDMQVAVCWQESTFLSLSLSGNLHVFNSTSPSAFDILQYHQVAITSLAYDPNGRHVFTGSFDGVICVASIQNGKSTKALGNNRKSVCQAVHGGMVSGIAICGNQVVSVGWDDTLRLGSLDYSRPIEFTVETACNGQPKGISAGADELIAVATNLEIALYRGLQKVAFLGSLSYTPTSISVYGKEEIAVGGSDFKTHIYSILDLNIIEIATIETRSEVTVVQYSPNGDCIAIGDAGRQVEVYERGTWSPRVKGRWSYHTSRITALAFSPLGDRLASGSLDENIYIWSFEKPTAQKQIPFAHMAGVTGLSWIDDDSLVSSGNDHCIVTWRVPKDAA